MPDPTKKTCSSCGATLTDTEATVGHSSFSVTSGTDSSGCDTWAAPSTDLAQCWRDGICPCCGSPGLREEA